MRSTIITGMLLTALANGQSTLPSANHEGPAIPNHIGAGNRDDFLASITLNGIANMGGHLYASLMVGRQSSGWLRADEAAGRIRVLSVEANSVRLLDMVSRYEFTVWLNAASVQDSRKASEGPAKYSREWVNSKQNPMLINTTRLPDEIAMNWAKLTQEEKESIIAYYKQYGWQLNTTSTQNGVTTDFVWTNIYQEERQAVLKENNEAFKASLSSDQLASWSEMSNTPALALHPGKLTTEEEAEIAARRARFQSFQATLSPRQRLLFQGRTDFTMHDWSKPFVSPTKGNIY